MAEEKTFSAKQVATRIGTEAKILRKFFRDDNSGYKAVGQGGRYEFPESDLPAIKKAFDEWNKGKTRRNRPTNAERALAEKAGTVKKKPQDDEKAAPRPRRKRSIQAPNPLDEDDLMTRCRSSIGERAKAHGVTVKQGQWAPIKKMLTLDEAKKIVPGLSPEDFDPEASSKAAANLEALEVDDDDLDAIFQDAVNGLNEDEEDDDEDLEEL